MKIAIIGGGWVGCHLAYKLKDYYNVTIFEKNETLFRETSYNNQNRLHFGFHYARSYETRELCKDTFDKFITDYGFSIEDVENNCYCVPNNHSIIDFETYVKIFDGFEHSGITLNLNNVGGCVNTKEKYINFKKCYNFFNEQLRNIVINKKITSKKLNTLSQEYDLIIDSTNNHLRFNNNGDNFFELATCLIYEKTGVTDFGALTMVDGNLFSIFPYENNLYTLTDVEFTPIKKFKTVNQLEKYKKKINSEFINKRVSLFENKVLKYFTEFKNNFKFKGYFLSTKSKIINESSTRYPIIMKNNNVISCFTGKIQGIYIIEDFVKNTIKEISDRS